ncbi:MAG: HAD-IB family hydrolase [Candidatus Acidiferrales bacterium]
MSASTTGLTEGRASGVGAFFDLDSTVLPAPALEWRFVGYLLERNQLKTANAGAWLAHFAKNILLNSHQATDANKRYLAGLRESLAQDWALASAQAAQLSDEPVFFPEAIARIAWHQARGDRVCIVSGTLAVLARELAKHLPDPVDMIATELETTTGYAYEHGDCESVWTGEISGAHMTGLAKARAVWHYAENYGIDLKRSYAYGDQHTDLPMLDAVGNPVAVNPTKQVARIARENGWEKLSWKMRASMPVQGTTRRQTA